MSTIDKLVYPDKVGYIIEKLNNKGFEAFLVGGCVRDALLGRTPYDWDITTNALPSEIKEVFDKTIDTGIKHGTVSVAADGEYFEVTTYRIDGEYSDNRRPDNVEFTRSLKEDLARRDFTINAMAYNYNAGLVDYFGGLSDLNNRTIKAVGDANLRFNEDALRMLRAVRFSAQLGFDIEPYTYSAIFDKSELIKNISSERVRDELTKILVSPNPIKFEHLYKLGLLKHIIPEFLKCFETKQNNPYHVYNVAEHILHTVENVPDTSILRWTMLLHDIGKPSRKTTDNKGIDHFYGHQQKSGEMADIILNRLKFDKESIRKILKLIFNHDIDIDATEKSIKKVINRVGEDLFLELVEVQRADALGQNREYLGDRLVRFENIKQLYNKIKEENHCLNKKELAINGDDLISLGMRPGKDMKKVLDYLLECVLESPELNNKEKLIDLARTYIVI